MRKFAIGLALICVHLAPAIHASDGAKSFKGWELYIWKDGEQWKFSLLHGTNALKDDATIKKAAVSGLEAIEKKLDGLAAKESVFLCGATLRSKAPSDVAKELVTYGEKRGLRVDRRE